MRESLAGFLSVVAAALAPSVVFGLFVLAIGRSERDVLPAVMLAFMVAFAHALILGLPVALALVHKSKFRLIPMTIAGAGVGFAPISLLALPPSGWLSYLQVVGAGAGLGACGGACFYAVHRLMSPNNSFKPKPLRGSA